jgi:hypothetical protein
MSKEKTRPKIVTQINDGIDSIIKRVEENYLVQLSAELESQEYHYEFRFFSNLIEQYSKRCIHVEVLEKETLMAEDNESLVKDWLKGLEEELNQKIKKIIMSKYD